jgi:hypothetical protein
MIGASAGGAVNAQHLPFASASLAALRLLVAYALTADETAPARPALLSHAGASGARPCQALAAVLCALRRRAAVPGVLDGILAATLGREAERYAYLSASGLERCWREYRQGLCGRELAALLWQVARREEGNLRALEAEIASASPPARLLSPQQRAFALPFEGDLDAA